MKKLLGASECDMNSLENEYNILSQLVKIDNNLNIIKIYGLDRKALDPTTTVLYVLMDLADNDWEKEINQRAAKKKRYSESELIKICKQLIPTFALLQKKGITHRDVKPQNILIFSKNNEYKLADFGEAKNKLRSINVTQKQTLRGTELYMSPLLFQRLKKYPNAIYAKHNSYKSDVFSFGLCLIFAANLDSTIIDDIREKENDVIIRKIITDKLKNYYSSKFIDFICKTLLVEEKDRFDFVELEDYLMKQFD